jgi:hypothetical protein
MPSTLAPIARARSTLGEHRHVCAFFRSPTEEYDTLLPFICDGLKVGERAYHLLPSKYRDEHLQQLRIAGIDVAKAQKNRQLEVAVPEDTYLRGGRFDKEAVRAPFRMCSRRGRRSAFRSRA